MTKMMKIHTTILGDIVRLDSMKYLKEWYLVKECSIGTALTSLILYVKSCIVLIDFDLALLLVITVTSFPNYSFPNWRTRFVLKLTLVGESLGNIPCILSAVISKSWFKVSKYSEKMTQIAIHAFIFLLNQVTILTSFRIQLQVVFSISVSLRI